MNDVSPSRAAHGAVVRAVFSALALLSLAGCHDYQWRGEFADPIERGLNEARILEHAFTINSAPFAYVVPGELGVLSLVSFNPADVALTYALETSLPVGPVTFAETDSTHAAFSFRPDETPLGQDVVFTVSVRGAKNGYDYPDYVFTLPCRYPEGNGLAVTFDLPDPVTGALAMTPASLVASHTSMAPFNIGPAPGFDTVGCAFAWYVDGTLQAGATSNWYAFDAAVWPVGQHIVNLVISRGASVWSAEMRFTVVP